MAEYEEAQSLSVCLHQIRFPIVSTNLTWFQTVGFMKNQIVLCCLVAVLLVSIRSNPLFSQVKKMSSLSPAALETGTAHAVSLQLSGAAATNLLGHLPLFGAFFWTL